MKQFQQLSIAMAAGFLALSVLAEPIVIKDYGNTRPTGIPTQDDIERLAKEMGVPPREIRTFQPYVFPIMSEHMKLGQLKEAVKHGKIGVIPFFVIGADEQSKGWVERNKQHLLDTGINRGLVTNVANTREYQRIVEAAKPLQLYALNADDVAEIFGVNVYPIVITRQEIQQ